jgi:hypothetical protein
MSWTALLVPAIVLVALVILALFPPIRGVIVSAFNVLPALALFALGCLEWLLRKPLGWLSARAPLLGRVADRFAATIERFGARKEGLPAGDREDVARELWPEERYPFLYNPVPDDIRRPLWEDGKLVGGHDIPWMADRHFSAGFVRAASQCGLAAALIALVAQPLLYLLWRGVPPGSEATAPVLLEQFPGEAPAYVSGWTVWQAVAGDWVGAIAGGALAIILVLAAWLLIAVAIAIIVAMMMVEHWRKQAAAPYEILS